MTNQRFICHSWGFARQCTHANSFILISLALGVRIAPACRPMMWGKLDGNMPSSMKHCFWFSKLEFFLPSSHLVIAIHLVFAVLPDALMLSWRGSTLLP
ncbi:hypothetical protein QQP08_008375 [Theobroma cacao]|nr:hypothetical protein QQP08_008375 [Theobroma cacao]